MISSLKEDIDSKFQIDPPKLIITHEMQPLVGRDSFSPNKNQMNCSNLFQKLNTTVINKTKQKIEVSSNNSTVGGSFGANHKSVVTSNNTTPINNNK